MSAAAAATAAIPGTHHHHHQQPIRTYHPHPRHRSGYFVPPDTRHHPYPQDRPRHHRDNHHAATNNDNYHTSSNDDDADRLHRVVDSLIAAKTRTPKRTPSSSAVTSSAFSSPTISVKQGFYGQDIIIKQEEQEHLGPVCAAQSSQTPPTATATTTTATTAHSNPNVGINEHDADDEIVYRVIGGVLHAIPVSKIKMSPLDDYSGDEDDEPALPPVLPPQRAQQEQQEEPGVKRSWASDEDEEKDVEVAITPPRKKRSVTTRQSWEQQKTSSSSSSCSSPHREVIGGATGYDGDRDDDWGVAARLQQLLRPRAEVRRRRHVPDPGSTSDDDEPLYFGGRHQNGREELKRVEIKEEPEMSASDDTLVERYRAISERQRDGATARDSRLETTNDRNTDGNFGHSGRAFHVYTQQRPLAFRENIAVDAKEEIKEETLEASDMTTAQRRGGYGHDVGARYPGAAEHQEEEDDDEDDEEEEEEQEDEEEEDDSRVRDWVFSIHNHGGLEGDANEHDVVHGYNMFEPWASGDSDSPAYNNVRERAPTPFATDEVESDYSEAVDEEDESSFQTGVPVHTTEYTPNTVYTPVPSPLKEDNRADGFAAKYNDRHTTVREPRSHEHLHHPYVRYNTTTQQSQIESPQSPPPGSPLICRGLQLTRGQSLTPIREAELVHTITELRGDLSVSLNREKRLVEAVGGQREELMTQRREIASLSNQVCTQSRTIDELRTRHNSDARLIQTLESRIRDLESRICDERQMGLEVAERWRGVEGNVDDARRSMRAILKQGVEFQAAITSSLDNVRGVIRSLDGISRFDEL